MAVPDYQTLMLPVLRFVASAQPSEVSAREIMDAVARELKLTDDDLNQLIPSGRQTTFANRVHWATTYMRKAGLLEAPRRAHLRITNRGLEVLSRKPDRVDNTILKQFPEFVTFQSSKANRAWTTRESNANEDSTTSKQTPLENLEAGYLRLRNELADELLERLKKSSPQFFERTVVELLVQMGYGGSRLDAARAIGRAHDGGIDGIIKEDKLGLDVIYVQAKRWQDTVGRPQIQQFAGALAGLGASKGIFITTSAFSDEARAFVSRLGQKIVLLDGEELADLMIDHGVGVTTAAVYEVKRVDSDFFVEEE
jgi:restriction system protein